MGKVSIIIPSYREIYLNRTLEDILEKAKGDIEILVHVDKCLPKNFPEQDINDDRVIFKYANKPQGMRAGINWGLNEAKGDYIMKCDAHCVFDNGFDLKLQKDMEDNWLVVPRRYSLYANGWKRDLRMPTKDYHYLAFPQVYNDYGYLMAPQAWRLRTRERMNNPKYEIDDTMSLQGSCWFANRNYFMERVGYLDDNMNTYSTFSGEQLEVGLKYALGGGEVKVNKKTWYAHLFKNKAFYSQKGMSINKVYKKSLKSLAGWDWATKHWVNNEEPNMIHPFSWLVEKFWPVPTWPSDRKLWKIK